MDKFSYLYLTNSVDVLKSRWRIFVFVQNANLMQPSSSLQRQDRSSKFGV
jgi:hypothetical protein